MNPTLPIIAACCIMATPAAADSDMNRLLFGNAHIQKAVAKPTEPGPLPGEQLSMKQIFERVDAALTRATMPKGPQRLLPPAQYDRPYKGELSVTYVETQKDIVRLCPQTGFALKLGCAYMSSPQAADGAYAKCRVILVEDGVVRAGGLLPETVYRHEIAHCNGWPDDHAGARLATDELGGGAAARGKSRRAGHRGTSHDHRPDRA